MSCALGIVWCSRWNDVEVYVRVGTGVMPCRVVVTLWCLGLSLPQTDSVPAGVYDEVESLNSERPVRRHGLDDDIPIPAAVVIVNKDQIEQLVHRRRNMYVHCRCLHAHTHASQQRRVDCPVVLPRFPPSQQNMPSFLQFAAAPVAVRCGLPRHRRHVGPPYGPGPTAQGLTHRDGP